MFYDCSEKPRFSFLVFLLLWTTYETTKRPGKSHSFLTFSFPFSRSLFLFPNPPLLLRKDWENSASVLFSSSWIHGHRFFSSYSCSVHGRNSALTPQTSPNTYALLDTKLILSCRQILHHLPNKRSVCLPVTWLENRLVTKSKWFTLLVKNSSIFTEIKFSFVVWFWFWTSLHLLKQSLHLFSKFVTVLHHCCSKAAYWPIKHQVFTYWSLFSGGFTF